MFLHQYEMIKHDYQRMIEEAQDLQGRLDLQTQQCISIERKLNYARKLLETERKSRKEAENEKVQLEMKLDSLRTLLINDNTMKDETRKHLQVLSTFAKKRKSTHQLEDEFNEINSTGSFLSDLSLTQSEDDILDPKPGGNVNQKWKKHRPSNNNISGFLNASANNKRLSVDKRRSARCKLIISSHKYKHFKYFFAVSLLDYGPGDKIVTQTKLTIPTNKYGPIFAEATIEPMRILPTASSTSSDEDHKNNNQYLKTPKQKQTTSEEQFKTPVSKRFFTPSAPSLDDLEKANDMDVYATVKKKTMTISGRPHAFSTKTFLKPDSCGACGKKIRFSSVALKCSECRTCIHQDCREKFTTGCLPQKSTPIAPKNGNVLGCVGDYAPNMAPQVPALIVHCVNEIEQRGLTEVGLYRVSGGDRDVKALKEKFLRNNGIPVLHEIDVHVLCGCIKDFLRSLKEPLIPLALWTTFSNAAQTIPTDDDIDVNKDVYRAIDKLPQPNRDTLAYLILHFQRISECPDVKMPLTNFAKIFGPTIVGYSCADPDQHKMFAETQVQFSVMFSLLNVPTDYWIKFITLNQATESEEKRAIETYGSKFYSGKLNLGIHRHHLYF
jgi:Rac GTPase-activating protein 1